MKQSWSDILFFRINEEVGKRPWLDAFMTFCAHYVLYVVFVVAFAWAAFDLEPVDPAGFERYLKLIITAGVFGFITSWSIGFFFPHKRPFKEHRGVTRLIDPLGAWKSFPSDHTIAGFSVALITCFVGAPVWLCAMLLVAAALVSIGRVYAGVHYPRDIVGGIMVALLFSSTSFWLLEHVTGPLYEGVKTFFS